MKIPPHVSLHPLHSAAIQSSCSRILPARARAALVAGAIALLAAVSSPAQTYTWDPLLNKAGSDGLGTWDTVTTDWASGGVDVAWPNTASLATIGSGKGAAGTITLGATTITNSGITFNSPLSGNYLLTGGNIWLAGSTPTITVNGSNALIMSALQGTSGLTTAGTGTLGLSGANTYSGPTTVSQGTLQLSNISGQAPVLPVLYMSFNQANGGTVTNQGTGGTAMNGTLHSPATIVSGGKFGHNALSIGPGAANAGGYVSIANAVVPFTHTANWTIAMWVQTTTAGGTYAYQGAGGWASGNITFYLNGAVQSGASGGHQGAVSYGQGWEGGSNSTCNDGNWHFLVIENNGSAESFYLDGAPDPVQTAFGGTGTGTGSQFWIGGSGDTGDGDVALNGLIGDTYVYNVALTQSQVQALMTASNGPVLVPTNLPPATAITVASGATLDLGGEMVTAAGLSGAGNVLSSLPGASLTLTNAATATATTNIFSGSITSVGGVAPNLTVAFPGALTLSGANDALTTFSIGGTPTNTVVNFSGTSFSNYQIQLGLVSGANAALYQTAGVLTIGQAAGGANFQIGNAAGAYGYYYLGAGASLVCNEIGVAGEGNSVAGFTAGAGNGLMEVKGGTVTDTGWLVMTRLGSGTQTGILNVYPGSTLNYSTTNGGGLVVNWGTAGTAVINVLGGLVTTTNNVPINLNDNNNAGNTGILNLNGGVTQTGYVTGGARNTYVNFNGGTLQADENQGSFMTGLSNAFVFGPGGTINNNGYTIAIGQPFVSPTSNGVAGITSFTGGTGYVAPPIVTVVRGAGDSNGVDATAIAQIDTSTGGLTSGQVTNVIITCPGVNYTATPTFTLTGGGPATPATITGAAPTPNTTGNLTFTGPGVTILSGSLTFSGKATVAQGTLEILGAGQADSTPIVVNDGANLIETPFGGGLFSPANLTVGSTTGGTLGVTASSSAQPAMTVGNLTLVGTTTVKVYGSLAAGNNYSLLAYTNLTGTLAAANFALPNGVTGNVTSATASGETIWSVSVVSVTNTIWDGAVNGTWDINTTANWLAPKGGHTYVDGSPVQFDDNPGDNTGGIYVITNLAATPLLPGSVYVSNAVNNYTFSSNVVITGPGGLIKDGAAALTNFGANTYTGPTVIKAGSLVAGAVPPAPIANVSGPFGGNSQVILSNAAGANLNLNNLSITIGSLSGGGSAGGNVILGSGRLTIGGDNSSQSYGGAISGTGGITQIGTGVVTLTGTNLFTGTIGGIAGTLTIGGAGQLNNGTYAATISDSGVFNYGSSITQTNSGVMSGSGVLMVSGSGPLTLSAINTFTGGTIVSNGATLNLRNGGGSGTIRGPLTILPGGTVNAYNVDAIGYNSGSCVSFLTNMGTFNDLSGGNESYITQWYLQGGTLAAPSGYINFNTGFGIFTLPTNVVSTISAGIEFRGNPLIYTVAQGTVPGGVDLLQSGIFYNGGTSAMVKTGPGTMALTGNDTALTGSITISGGTLILGDPGVLASGTYSGTFVNNGTFIYASSTPQTIKSVISGAGLLVVSNTSGSGLTLLSNANTYTGPTVIEAGTLLLSGTASIALSSNIVISNGAVLDVTQLTAGTAAGPGQTIMGFGNVNGNFTSTPSSIIEGGLTNASGTLTFNNNLTLGPASGFRFILSSSATGQNSQVLVTGTLACSGAQMHITAPSGQNLDTRNYTLITAGSLAGASVSPAVAWDVAPANQNHYYITNINNSVVLAYSSIALPTPGGVTTPTLVLRNQTPLLVVTVVPGSGAVTNVTVDASNVGGTNKLAMTANGVANTWTNSVSIAASLPPGSYLLPATAIDTVPVTGYGAVSVFVVASTETWAGAGANGNFGTTANWAIESGQTAAYAPGYVGDSLVFAGTTGLNPVMDTNYTLNTLLFTNGAGSFNITAASTNVLTLVAGGITNLAANVETLNMPITLGSSGIFTSTAGNLVLNGGLSDGGAGYGLTINGPVTGTGTVTLAGTNTETGLTVVNSGTLNLTSTATLGTNTLNMLVGSPTTASSNAVLKTAGTFSTGQLWVGNVSNGAAAVYQTGGNITLTSTGVEILDVGNVGGSYGYYNAAGGTITTYGIAVGGEGNATLNGTLEGSGIMDITGGNITNTGWGIMTRGTGTQTGSIGILNLYSGSLTYAGGGFVVNWGTGQTAMLNIMGGALSLYNGAQEPINLNDSANSANTGILNLLGGVTQADSVVGTGGFLNFNGGVLAPSETITSFINSVAAATVYAGGGTISNNGYTVTIPQGLMAPSGNGLAGITTFTGGAGYIAPPIVLITNVAGGGTGATAIAQINPATGVVTNILITCPGINYTNSPTFVFSGGGATTKASVTASTIAPNASGPMNFTGTGQFILTGANTYTNATIVQGGTVQLGAGGSLNNSAVLVVSNGATLDGSVVGGFTLNAQTLNGAGTVLGPVTVNSGSSIQGQLTLQGPVTANFGSAIYPGADPAVGQLSFNSGLNMQLGAIATFDLSTSGTGNNDQVIINGNQSVLSFANNTIHIKAPSTSASLDTTIPYALFQNNSALALGGLPNPTPVFDVAPANKNTGFWLIQPNGNGIVLKNSSVAPPTGTGSITSGATSGTNVIRNTTIAVSATIAPSGSRTVQSVTVDLSAYSGSVTHFTQGAGNNWSGTVLIAPGLPPGPFSITILAYDGILYGEVSVPINVLATVDTWSGADFVSQQVSDDNLNWVGGLAPGYIGDSAIFAGVTGLTPVFDQNYSFNGIGFASNAGPFVLSTYNTVAVVGGITNNSTNNETVMFPLALTGTSTYFTSAAGNLGLSNTVSGPGQLNVAGAGSVTLGGTASYLGNTFIASGATLILGANAQWSDAANNPSYAGAITDNGTFIFDSTISQTNAGVITGNGGLIMNGPGTLVTRAANSFTNNFVINGGTVSDLYNGQAGGVSGFGSTAIDGRTVTINNGGIASLDGSGGNGFGGGGAMHHLVFVVNPGGLLQVTSGNDVFTNIVLNGGTVLAAPASSIYGNGYPTFELGGSIITAGTNSSSVTANAVGTYAAEVGFALGVSSSAGYQTPFIVNPTAGGSLAASPQPDLTVSATLLNAANTGTVGNATGFIKTGLGTMLLNGTNYFTGPITVGNGTLILGGGIQFGSNASYAGNIVVSNGATLALENSQAQAYTGVISGAGTLLVSNTSSPALTLSTANTLTGLVVITNGTLALTTGGSFNNSSGVSIAGGATFDVSGLASPYVWPATGSVIASGTAANPATVNSAGAVSLSSGNAVVLTYDDTDAAPQPALNINGNLTLGGNAFTVNTADGLPLAKGTYVLIQASGSITSSGAYPAVTGTAIGSTTAGAITVNGSQVLLTVGSSINTNPPPMQFSRAGTVLTLSWPTNSGWTLESNSINVALTNDWFRIPGTSAVTNFQINLTAAKTNVFYRLVYP